MCQHCRPSWLRLLYVQKFFFFCTISISLCLLNKDNQFEDNLSVKLIDYVIENTEITAEEAGRRRTLALLFTWQKLLQKKQQMR